MKEQSSRVIHIWDHPESRIQYLETVLNNSEWQASVYASSENSGEKTDLHALAKTLSDEGYITEIAKDEHQQEMLKVKHLQDNSGLVNNVQSLGLSTGVAQTIKHPVQALSSALSSGKELAHYVTSDHARLLSSFYLLGDVALSFAGLHSPTVGKEASESLKKLEKTLHQRNNIPDKLLSLSGLLAAAQSVVYIGYAHDGETQQRNELEQSFGKGLQSGYQSLDVQQWRPEQTNDKKTPFSGVQKLLKDHPIQVGAASQVLASAAILGSAGMRLKNIKQMEGLCQSSEAQAMFSKQLRGSQLDIGSALMTGTSWSILAQSPTDKDGNPSFLYKHLKRPERLSAFLSTASTFLGIRSGLDKQNKFWTSGQSVYLLGDATMFMLNTSNYGKDGTTAEELAATAATKFIEDSPMILGTLESQQFIGNLSAYISEKVAETQSHTNAETFKEKLVPLITEKYDASLKKSNALTEDIARLVQKFPEQQQSAVLSTLTEKLATLPGVFMSSDEMTHKISGMMPHLAHHNDSLPHDEAPPNMHALSPIMAEIIHILPPLNAGESANVLYSALLPHIKPTPRDVDHLTKNVVAQAAEASGISEQTLKRELSPSTGHARSA